MSSPKKNASGNSSSPPSHGHDLVTATMTVTAPPHGTLTGNQREVRQTGKNTAWAKTEVGADVSRYQSRKSYVQANHADHPFAGSLLGRHENPEADKRGLSCAEGHSVIETHTRLNSAGREHASAYMDAFKESLIPTPTFGKNAKRAHINKLMNNREARLNAMAKEMTGMDSWEHYAAKESSFMAWNDIQQHGQISQVRHHEFSAISAGQPMAYCEHCRADIVNKMRKHD